MNLTDYHHGAHYDPTSGQTHFHTWAPACEQVALHITAPTQRTHPMQRDEHGYWHATLHDAPPGTHYLFQLQNGANIRTRPDPASRAQPDGVHAPSAVVDTAYAWQAHDWRGIPLERYIVYELHVGTFTLEGTFAAIIPHLPYLRDLGVTAIELLPVAQFPGSRNWGYDGVYPFATQHSYGGLCGLQQLVDACHQHGLAVILDVVYNHLGPEGNYLWDYAPYFTDRYHTPWGSAINFDGADSDPVRAYFIQNALQWLDDCRIDALRLDAVHSIMDASAYPFLEELADHVRDLATQTGRAIYLIPESDQNDPRLLNRHEHGGFALDAQWSDDVHHIIHALLTGEQQGYYADFGGIEQLATAYRDGWIYSGAYSQHRQRRHGRAPTHLQAPQFVVFSQNHDQVGNRMRGERLAQLVPFAASQLAAAMTLLSPFVPLLFMGEEYAEPAPFPYFISHGDPGLVAAVQQGRKAEFAGFAATQGEPPDPQAEATFASARLNHTLHMAGSHAVMLAWYRSLIALRTTTPALAHLSKEHTQVHTLLDVPAVVLHRQPPTADAATVLVLFAPRPAAGNVTIPAAPGTWRILLDSGDDQWHEHATPAPDPATVLAAPARTVTADAAGLTLPVAPYGCVVLAQ